MDAPGKKIQQSVMYNLLSRAVEQTADSVVITDQKGVIVFVNAGFENTTGYTSQEAIGRTPNLLKSGFHDAAFYKDVWGKILHGQNFRGTILNKKKDGAFYWSEQTITPLTNEGGEITHFVSVLKDITDLIEKERLEGELRAAAEIQKSILPDASPDLPGFDIAASMIPARYVSGDFYDFFKLGRNRVGILIGDASDKGIAAALFMARVHALVTAETDATRTPADVLQRVNRHVMQFKQSTQFVTMLYGILDSRSGEFEYARAGHEPPILLLEDATIHHLPHKNGMALGINEKIILDENSLPLPKGSTLLLFTDGLTDSRNPEGESFALEGLQKAIGKSAGISAQTACERVLEEFNKFLSNARLDDDVTLVAVHMPDIH